MTALDDGDRRRRPTTATDKGERRRRAITCERRAVNGDGWMERTILKMNCDTLEYSIPETKLNFTATITDFEKWLDIVVTLQAKKISDEAQLADFEVSEGIYSRARIEHANSVCLWRRANVMLEYSCEEATTLLQKNLENAKAVLEVLVADLQFLLDQVTITQITIAHVYNWDVHQKRIRQAGAPAKYS
ncbi:hypothetical protein ACJRO7_020676 [Eucalyptus globulus]|uniref:Uncharacterized protein n=1 Tax=Eucalyptus globulus TaxID=34317 RepID=A0ABD3KLT8_EUCGL